MKAGRERKIAGINAGLALGTLAALLVLAIGLKIRTLTSSKSACKCSHGVCPLR